MVFCDLALRMEQLSSFGFALRESLLLGFHIGLSCRCVPSLTIIAIVTLLLFSPAPLTRTAIRSLDGFDGLLLRLVDDLTAEHWLAV